MNLSKQQTTQPSEKSMREYFETFDRLNDALDCELPVYWKNDGYSAYKDAKGVSWIKHYQGSIVRLEKQYYDIADFFFHVDFECRSDML